MKTRLFVVFLLAPMLALAQTPAPTATPDASRTPMWRCDLPGGTYEVAIRAIQAVSTHEYIVDGVARVTEMNIDTAGTMAVRFYYIEPLTPSSPVGIGQSTIDKVQDMAKEALGRVSPGQQPVWEKVVKNYPTTTHAHTIEYRLDSKDQLQQLFNSAEQAFRLVQNTRITLQ
jgi:hypothetical protein